jgi:hypothetical protein
MSSASPTSFPPEPERHHTYAGPMCLASPTNAALRERTGIRPQIPERCSELPMGSAQGRRRRRLPWDRRLEHASNVSGEPAGFGQGQLRDGGLGAQRHRGNHT